MSSNTSGTLRPTPAPTHAAIRTPLARARGLGSAHGGTVHFWLSRLTGAALVPLTLYLVWFIARYAGADYAVARGALRNPLAAVPMLLLVLVGIYHMHLGMKEIIEDYVHGEGTKLILVALNVGFAILVAAACVFAILKLSLGAS